MRENIYSQRKLGPLAFTIFDHPSDLVFFRISDEVFLVDSSYLNESYLFYSSQEKFEKVEEEIRKSREIVVPSSLIYHEYQKSFTFNNPSYNKVKGYENDHKCTGYIRVGHIIPYNILTGIDLAFQTRFFIEKTLDEIASRLDRAISKNGHLIQVTDRVEYKNQDGVINSFKRFLGVGGIKQKIHYSTEIDKSRIDLQTIVNHSFDKIKRSCNKAEKEEFTNFIGILIFRLLLTDSEKELNVLYSR